MEFKNWWGIEKYAFRDVHKGQMKFWIVYSPIIRVLAYALGFLVAGFTSWMLDWNPDIRIRLAIVIAAYVFGYYLDTQYDNDLNQKRLWLAHGMVSLIILMLLWW